MNFAALGVAAMAMTVPVAVFAQDAPAVVASPQTVSPPPPASAGSGTDFTLGLGMMRDSDHHAFAGFRATVSMNLTDTLAVIGEGGWLVAGAEHGKGREFIRDWATTALGGIRVRRFVEAPAVPYLQVAAGYARRTDNALQIRRSLFAFRSEVGLDFNLTDHFGMRVGGGWTYSFVDAPYRHEFGATVGATLSLGRR